MRCAFLSRKKPKENAGVSSIIFLFYSLETRPLTAPGACCLRARLAGQLASYSHPRVSLLARSQADPGSSIGTGMWAAAFTLLQQAPLPTGHLLGSPTFKSFYQNYGNYSAATETWSSLLEAHFFPFFFCYLSSGFSSSYFKKKKIVMPWLPFS